MTHLELIWYLSAPLIAFCLHAFLNRVFYPRLSAQVIALFSIILASFFSLGFGWLETQQLSHFILGCVISFGLLHVYFHFFNMSETARRIRILHSIHKKEIYSEESGLTERISRLVQLGLVTEREEGLSLTSHPLKYLALAIIRIEYLLFPERIKS